MPSSLSVGSPDLVHVDRNAEALPRRFVPLSWAACLPCLVRAKNHNGTVSLWGGWRVCELSGPLSFHSHPSSFAGLQPPLPSGRKCALHERMQTLPFPTLSARHHLPGFSAIMRRFALLCPTPEFSTFSNFPLSSYWIKVFDDD